MPKILLVEDDNNLREIFQMRLQAEGYATIVAADGEEGLVVAMKEKPDLLIADVMMPKLSGFEMVESLRAAPETKNIKVVMMTALGQAEDQARGEKLGVLKYLVKSQVTLEDFARVVKETLGPGDSSATAPPSSDEVSNNNQQESENHMQEDPNASTNPAPTGDTGVPTPPAVPPVTDVPAPAADAQQTSAQEAGVVQDQVDQFAAAPAADAPAVDAPAPAADVPTGDAPAPVADAPVVDPAAPPTDPASNAL